MVEKIKAKYREMTGQEPLNLVILGEETAKKMAEIFPKLYGGHFDSDKALHEMRFYTVKKIQTGYQIHTIDIHKKKDGHYEGVEVEVATLPTEIQLHAKRLKFGQTTTYYYEAKTPHQIAEMTGRDLISKPNRTAEREVENLFSLENLTEEKLKEHPYEYFGNFKDGYVAAVPVTNKHGLHFSPISLLNKIAKTTDCDVNFRNKDKTASLGSVMQILTLETMCGDTLVIEAKGEQSEECIKQMITLFKRKFGED
jgi:phosphocarrier protein HPr